MNTAHLCGSRHDTNEELFVRAKQVFLAACELPVEQHAACLAELCGDNEVLRQEVRELLSCDTGAEPDTFPGTVEGYEVLGKIGRGGMGDVWEAEQLAPIRRRVALKLIRGDVSRSAVLARFETERQALALMNHAGIATVYAAGSTSEGCPYFAMELVDGVPITQYCDDRRLGLRDRLELFIQVCEGVQHAHHKGVIHRDLKPGNVLVSEVDGRPVPKIIDFGVAKAISRRLTDSSLTTERGIWLGTPEYMSPEQAGLTGADVDTRSDVYALGVLLYELLAGTRPFDGETLRRAGIAELCRILKEEEPPRPSTRVSSLGADSEEVAGRRRTDSSSLVRLLRGDLDWIVMRALEKDRDRRYGSPAELQADIRRYFASEPVQARPPSAVYRARKLVARHRLSVTAALMMLAALVAGITTTIIAAVRAHNEAEAASQVAESMAAVFGSLLPRVADTRLNTARQALSRGAEIIESQLEDRPIVRGRLKLGMAQAYLTLDEFDRAIEVLEEALAIVQPQLDDADPLLGDLYRAMGICLYQKGELAASQASFERAVAEYTESSGPEQLITGMTLADLAYCLFVRGEFEQARSVLERAERIIVSSDGACCESMALVLRYRGEILLALGELAPAQQVLERSVTLYERWLGRDHIGVTASLADLAGVHMERDDLDGAEALFRRVLDINRRAYGDDHCELVVPLRELGRIATKRGSLEEARRLTERSLKIAERSLGEHHPELILSLSAHAGVLVESGDVEGAKAAITRALAAAETAFGSHHPFVAGLIEAVGDLEYRDGHLEEAREQFQTAGKLYEAVYPANHRSIGSNWYQQACMAALLGEHSEALVLLKRAFETDWISDRVLEDPDLDSLRDDPEFQEILREARIRLARVQQDAA